MNATLDKPATAKAPAVLCACGGQMDTEYLFLQAGLNDKGMRFIIAQTCQGCASRKLGDVINGR